MDTDSLVDEIEALIARIERTNRAQMRARDITSAKDSHSPSRHLYQARQSRLWWLRRVRDGILAQRPRNALLH